MGMKSFLMKKMLKSKLKHLPQDQQDKIIAAIEKNPQLFEKMAKEIKQLTKEGQNETAASMQVMRKYQAELRDLMM